MVEKEIEEKENPVILKQSPTEYEIVFQTPDGVFNEREYLAWLGNMLVDIKQGIVG